MAAVPLLVATDTPVLRAAVEAASTCRLIVVVPVPVAGLVTRTHVAEVGTDSVHVQVGEGGVTVTV
jgi:hypothetical protein